MTKLNVFDVQRFALHDGPGVRTTVFLKGCPLDCAWCHNPESKKSAPQLGCLYKNCTACGKCAQVCPNGVHSISADGQHIINYAACKACRLCVQVCAQRALKLYGQQTDIDALLSTVLRDKDFYDRSGGGLTVSGGEAMLQFEPLLELLRRAKALGLHTCLDTSGFASSQRYRQILPYVDVFLYDYKITDPQEHRRWTGVDSKPILDNLDMLCNMGAQVYLRCPIIPGVNDNDDHYKAIAELSARYPAIKEVNVMAYHDMGKSKSRQIGEAYALAAQKTVEKEEKEAIYRRLEYWGCKKLKES